MFYRVVAFLSNVGGTGFGAYGEAFDTSGNFYLTEYLTDKIYKVTPAGAVSPFASGFNNPNWLAFDSSGNLYVTNYGSNSVSKITPSGQSSIFATVGNQPIGLAIDAFNNLYVAVPNSGLIKQVTPGGSVSTFLSGLSSPRGVAFDSSGNLYATTSTGILKVTFSAPGVLGSTTTYVAGLSGEGMVFDSTGNSYVTDGGASIYIVPPGGGSYNSLVTGLNSPRQLIVDAAGNLYASNIGNDTVSKVTLAPATSSVTIQSSVESRPMLVGGTNNSAVAGINLTSAELARIVTSFTATVTIGDSNQTGNITFTTATPATTAGAATTVVQSSSGGGQIILDNGSGSGTALNGNGGAVTITAGTGGIVEAATNTTAAADLSGASTSLTTAAAIGTSGNPIQLAATSLTTVTSANNSSQFLTTAGTVTASSLNAGSGTITLAGTGTFQAGSPTALTSTSSFAVNGTLDLHGNSETINGLSGSGTVDNTVGGGPYILSLGGSNATSTFAGIIKNSVGTLALTKQGSGTLTLSGSNTYTGSTTVTAGTLLANGSTAAGSVVTVSGTGVLGGTGTVGGSVAVNSGGTITGGTLGGIGTLTVGSLTFNGGTYAADFNGNTSDTIATAGAVNLNAGTAGSFSVNSQSGTATAANVFVLIDNTGSAAISNPPLSGAAQGGSATIDGLTGTYSYTGSNGSSFVFAGPSLNVSTNSLNLGTTTAGTAGTAYSYTVGGSYLTANISIVAPSGVELSLDDSTWATSETLTPTSGTVATTTVYARIAATTTPVTVGGNITNKSTGATEQDVSVSGTVTPAAASQLVFTTSPSGATAGSAFTIQPVVQTEDAYGNPSTLGLPASDTVTVAIKTGTGTLLGTTAYDIGTAHGNGTITGSGLEINQAGSFTLKATVSSGLSEGDSSSFIVSPTTANAYRISAASATPMAGSNDPLTITLVDQFGNTETGFSGTETLTFSGLSTSTAGNVPTVTNTTGSTVNEGTSEVITFASGVSSAANSAAVLVAYTAETKILNVTDSATLSSTNTGGTGQSLKVSTAAASKLVVTTEPSSTATTGVAFATQPVVAEEDTYGNVITTDSTHTVTAARGSVGTGALQGSNLTLTLSSGVATFIGLYYNVAETMNIAFSTNAGVFTATSNNLVVSAGSANGVSAKIDDGTAQRSMVRSITLTFSSSIASTLTTVMASLSLTRTSDNLSVGLRGTLDSTGKVLTLTFTGSSIIGGSLADGRYTLMYGSTTLLAAGTAGQTDETKYLWRLFGDLNGTASVNAADLTAFNKVYNSRKGMSNYSVYFDYNEDGLIVNGDQTAFMQRYGTSI